MGLKTKDWGILLIGFGIVSFLASFTLQAPADSINAVKENAKKERTPIQVMGIVSFIIGMILWFYPKRVMA